VVVQILYEHLCVFSASIKSILFSIHPNKSMRNQFQFIIKLNGLPNLSICVFFTCCHFKSHMTCLLSLFQPKFPLFQPIKFSQAFIGLNN
jgi:hypothetical protein